MDLKQANLDGNSRTPISLEISSLTLNGYVSPNGVATFLNIPYATIPARFRQSQPIDIFTGSGSHDATRYGPRCPQPSDVGRLARDHLYAGVEPSSATPVDEFGCLNLNIYLPGDVVNGRKVQDTAKLPVFVWIHGGAWTLGDGGSDYSIVHSSSQVQDESS